MPRQITNVNKVTMLLVVGIFGMTALGCSIFRGSTIDSNKGERYKMKRKPFEEKTKDFVNLPAKVQLTKTPYIKGKAAFYKLTILDDEISEKEAPSWFLENHLSEDKPDFLDEKVQDVTAQTTEEVSTVVLSQYTRFRAGSYSISGKVVPGYEWRCEVIIVDRTIPAVIYRQVFNGKKLDMSTTLPVNTNIVVADSPTSDIYSFLGGLPRR